MKKQHLLIMTVLLIFAGAIVLQAFRLGGLWTDDGRGWTGAYYGNIARNYLKFGLKETRSGMVLNVNPKSPAEFRFYINHPPMAGWLTALSFKIFGYREWAERLVAAVCFVGSLAVFCAIVKKFSLPAEWLAATALFAVLPMALYYGTLVDPQGPILLFFCLLVILAYLRFRENPSTGNTLLLLLSFIPAAATDWPAYYLAPLLLAHYLITARRRNWKIILLPLFAVAVFVFYVFYASYVRTGVFSFDVRRFVIAFIGRAGTTVSDVLGAQSFSLGDWFNRVVIEWWPLYFTWPALVLAAGWLAACIVRIAARRAEQKHWLFLLFVAFGATHLALFRQGSYNHQFWSYYLLPVTAFGAACAIAALARLVAGRRAALSAAIVLAALGGIAAWSFINESSLEARAKTDQSITAKIISTALPPESTLLIDLPGRYGFDFYIRVPVESILVTPGNLQLLEGKTGDAFIFLVTEGGKESELKKRLLRELERSHSIKGQLAMGTLASLAEVDLKRLIADVPPPPRITEVRRDGDNFILHWEQEGAHKPVGYRVYFRSEKRMFYTDYVDVGEDKEFVFNNGAEYVDSLIVVALFEETDAEGGKFLRESGFFEEIDVRP